MEKSYSDFMKEISADDLYEGLLAHGLFAEKLPPVFSSEGFYRFCQTNTRGFDGNPHQYVYYENMRNINIPRPLAIPNPMAYQLECATLKEYWPQIQKHFFRNTGGRSYKVSQIHIRKMHGFSPLFRMNYDNWRTDGNPEVKLSFGKKYMVKADISSCFPSMYTHALSWALVGKNEAKKNRTNGKLWYNKIDKYTRNTTHDETHGLLIGPHASNLLSEIVLTAVDNRLINYDYIRAIDDYTCYTETYEEAQRFLTELGSALREFDLSLNHKKTAIKELPLPVTEEWQRKLNAAPLAGYYGECNFLLTRAYIDCAIELVHRNGENAAILNYAIKVLLGKKLTPNAREYAAKTILNLALLYPYLVSILDKHVFSVCCAECPSHSCIKEYAQKIYQSGLASRNFEQVSFSIFFALKYKFELNCFDISEVIRTNDGVLLLMAYLYTTYNNRKNDLKELKTFAKALKDDLDTFDQYWVFLYEILPRSELKAEWKRLKENNVSFIKDISTW